MTHFPTTSYDLLLVRRLLHALGAPADDGSYVTTDGVTLSPPPGFALSEELLITWICW